MTGRAVSASVVSKILMATVRRLSSVKILMRLLRTCVCALRATMKAYLAANPAQRMKSGTASNVSLPTAVTVYSEKMVNAKNVVNTARNVTIRLEDVEHVSTALSFSTGKTHNNSPVCASWVRKSSTVGACPSRLAKKVNIKTIGVVNVLSVTQLATFVVMIGATAMNVKVIVCLQAAVLNTAGVPLA